LRRQGCLIVFEGIDGAGKTTQSKILHDVLARGGHRVKATKEPTGSPSGERIRELAREGRRESPEIETDLFLRDRRSHVEKLIGPALEDGAVVISDRYYLSTVAYQGARGLDPALLLLGCEQEFPVPDLALILDVSPEEGLRRIARRQRDLDPAFERIESLVPVSALFRSLARPYISHIDGEGTIGSVSESILGEVRAKTSLL
jgi:dTMP kinase